MNRILPPLRLAFDDRSLETSYRRDYDWRNRIFNRLGCLLSIIVWAGTTACAYFILPRVYPHLFFFTLAIVIPAMTLVIVMTFFPRLTPVFPWASGLANALTAFVFMYLSVAHYYNQIFLTAVMILMSLYAFFIFRLRFPVALLFTTVYMIVYQGLLLVRDIQGLEFYIGTVMIWASQTAFMISGHLMERTSRSLFASTKALTERNRVIERDLVIARSIMNNLLPKDITALPGVTAEALYIPLDRVGGDFYGISTHDETIHLFIADVTGHGLASSYLALVTKLSLDSINPAATADRALEELNDKVCDATAQSNFVTAFLGRLDPAAGTLSYASAGHPPALLYRHGTGEMMELRTGGRFLGWLRKAAYREESVLLKKGDRLVFYTDGVTECRDREDRLFGEEGLKDFIRHSGGVSAGQFVRGLLDTLRLHAGGSAFDDDITLLVVDIT